MNEFLKNNNYDIILDVREDDEWTEGHVAGARHLPLGNITEFKANKNTNIAVYCHSGKRAQVACDFLQAKGYHVTNIGGIIDGSIQLVHD